MKAIPQNLITKYEDYTTKDLKKALSNLKLTTSDLTEIKYVSRMLRDKLRNYSNLLTDSNQDESRHIYREIFLALCHSRFE